MRRERADFQCEEDQNVVGEKLVVQNEKKREVERRKIGAQKKKLNIIGRQRKGEEVWSQVWEETGGGLKIEGEKNARDELLELASPHRQMGAKAHGLCKPS